MIQTTIHLFFKSCKNENEFKKRKLAATEEDAINVKSMKNGPNENAKRSAVPIKQITNKNNLEDNNNNEKTEDNERDDFIRFTRDTLNKKLTKKDSVNIITCSLPNDENDVTNIKNNFSSDSTNIHRWVPTKRTTNINEVRSLTNHVHPNLNQFIVDFPIPSVTNETINHLLSNICRKRKILLQLIENYQNSIRNLNFLPDETNASNILYPYAKSKDYNEESGSSVKRIDNSNDKRKITFPLPQKQEDESKDDSATIPSIDNYEISDLRAIIETNDGFTTCFTYCDAPNRVDTNVLTNRFSVTGRPAIQSTDELNIEQNDKYKIEKKPVCETAENIELKLEEIYKSVIQDDEFKTEEKHETISDERYACKLAGNIELKLEEINTSLMKDNFEFKTDEKCLCKKVENIESIKNRQSEIRENCSSGFDPHFKNNIKKSLRKQKKLDYGIKSKKIARKTKTISSNVPNAIVTRSKVHPSIQDQMKVKKLRSLNRSIVDGIKSDKSRNIQTRFWTLRNRLSTRLSKRNCESSIKKMVTTRSARKKLIHRPKNMKPKKTTKKQIKQKENVYKRKGNKKKQETKSIGKIKKTNRSRRPVNVRGPQIINGSIAENLVQPCRKFPLVTNPGNRVLKTVENQKHKVLKPYLPSPKPEAEIKKYGDDLADYAHLLPGAGDLRNNNFTEPYSLIERVFLKFSPLVSMR